MPTETYQLREYFVHKFDSTFHKSYPGKSYAVDYILLKRLLTRYDKYVILEAIDIFFTEKNVEKSTINFFASQKVFSKKFDKIIKLSPIIKYKRFFSSYPVAVKNQVKPLVKEYLDYCSWETISDDEKRRKAKILEELELATESETN